MLNLNINNRYKACGTHLVISFLIAIVIFYLCFYVWYPYPLIKAGGIHGLTLLLSVDIVLGPLLTLMVFEQKKPRLKSDLACIGIFQFVCLFVGLWFVFNEKPELTVLADDGMHIVSRADRALFINNDELKTLKKNNKKVPFYIAKIPFDFEAVVANSITKEFYNEIPFELITNNYQTPTTVKESDFLTHVNLINKNFINEDQQKRISALKNQSDISNKNCLWTVVRSNHFEGFACINLQKGIIQLTK